MSDIYDQREALHEAQKSGIRILKRDVGELMIDCPVCSRVLVVRA
jgi:hypothetical protein